MSKRYIIISLMMFLAAMAVQAQNSPIVIGGSIYGGGNAGDTGGSTTVTVCAGEIGAVYGGARMANVGGSAFVNIDGEHASADILISTVYGGNDISGTIGTSSAIPTELRNVIKTDADQADPTKNNIDNSWNAFIRTSPCPTKHSAVIDGSSVSADKFMVVIGTLFGGGNGEYYYRNEGDTHEIYQTEKDFGTGKQPIASNTTGFLLPELDKTYLELKGGCIAHVYGGGNNATVTNNTTINIDNTSDDLEKAVKVWAKVKGLDLGEVFQYLINSVKIPIFQSNLSSFAYNFSRVFGGNNMADMAIRPTWNLQKGIIRDLYSGGNQGAMTHTNGILLSVKPKTSADLKIENVFGGCRMADVNPDKRVITKETIDGTEYPAGYAARLLIMAGDINNVYGGNDISGNVYGGNAVGIHSSIRGDVYGGGNGSYAYTDNEDLGKLEGYKDFYYNPGSSSSEDALNAFRPNAEAVSIRVVGQYEKDNEGKVIESSIVPTVIGGAIYCGGNSATLRNDDPNKDAAAELKIGSYVIADKVFLGNNGVNMKDADILEHYAKSVDAKGDIVETGGYDFSTMNLTNQSEFEKYMDGVTMTIKPRVTFDPGYIPYSTKFGSFYCGGNVGSMKFNGASTVDFNDKVIIFEKLVGGSNDANVAEGTYNAAYEGGLLGEPADNGNKLVLNLGGLRIQPMRWKKNTTTGDYVLDANNNRQLEWNTISASTGEPVYPTGLTTGTSTDDDLDRRLLGGNVYGGCYNTGHVNGSVVININETLVDRRGEYSVFDETSESAGEAILDEDGQYNITQRRSGVILDAQGDDVLGQALNVFGGGYGPESEIWGSTTINVKAGYAFQVFGGGEQGPIGKADPDGSYIYNYKIGGVAKSKKYSYNPDYSCYVNLRGNVEGVYRDHADDIPDMAETEYLYGGAFEAPIAGNVVVSLGNGRTYQSFGGSCNADILGHTETYIGRQATNDGYTDGGGFPWVRDNVFGGNDFGGRVRGKTSFLSRVSEDVRGKVYKPQNEETPSVTNASAYVEYQQGHVIYIFGGCYGDYDYTDAHFSAYTNSDGSDKDGFTKPRMDNAFVNFLPIAHTRNTVTRIFGAGQGHEKGMDVDKMQNRSYVLVEMPQSNSRFLDMAVFGAGANCGLGMEVAPADVEADPLKASAVVDLVSGQMNNAYGGSFAEGITRRTVVNVPSGATIQLNNIFGGAYGADPMYPCDVYEAQVNYHSEAARVGTIFGGNNSADRTFYGQVNVDVPVWSDKESGYMATVFGAGFGKDTWSQYTEVNLLEGAKVYEVYGGGKNGKVLNTESLYKWRYDECAGLDLSIPGYEDTSITYKDKDNKDFHLDAGLNSPLAHAVRLDGKKYNTNVHIYKGATVGGYAYGGGLGADAVVSGTTYIDLLGGTVTKDLYAGGTSGAVQDYYKVGAKSDSNPYGFTAIATAYIEGGTVRNVYGGGWEGHVGYTKMENGEVTEDIPGKTNVVIGIRKDQPEASLLGALQKAKADATLADYGYYIGVPAIQRNAYSGGEGGSVFGTANLTLNNGYIGYIYNTETSQYEEKIHDETWTDHVGLDRLSDCGNLFGGGYDDNSSVDFTNVTVWGGIVRNSVFGGGEIATIGRGKVKESDTDNKVRELESISKFGGTKITIYNGHVKRNVFGGGKGYNILGYGGIHGFYTDGYVFGQTEIYIHGGEIGTEAGLAEGYGNVFGGGDVGFVYGKGFFTNTSGKTSTGAPGHYYYYDTEGHLTEDCKVVVAPMLQLKPGKTVSFGGKDYGAYDYVPTEYLNTLSGDKTATAWTDLFTGDKNPDGSINPDDPVERGIQIRNAVFAGGNVSSNSESYNNATTVFGNTTATLYDVFHRDFITVGTEHTGGLYGGGNLSVVGGYRELNITNYGTDYYGMNEQISLDEYQTLTNRERAYFKLEYQFQKEGPIEINGKIYKKNDRISEDDYDKMPTNFKTEEYWKQYGFCSIYAGRLLNTIQRADFCGVFGSRLVLQGAKDRVADVGDATEYTINRVGELSLNQQRSVIDDDLILKPGATQAPDPSDQSPDDYVDTKNAIHGNYFGIYSIVNYLGNLTSDVHFTDTRRYILNGQSQEDPDGKSYYDYKVDNLTKRDRNNGTSLNQVALASGVYLEITSENSTPTNKIYGDITGIVELDLINVKKDIEGGGYVYARNEHGDRTEVANTNVLLSPYNKEVGNEAKTKKIFTYSATTLYPYQTSGNFIHKSKRIVDDCYPNNGVWTDNKGNYVTSPAHYWFIKGEVYIYDQVVSAYAGSATAYSKEVKIPLTITAGSNGKLQLLNIQPSLYAYYGDANRDESKKITEDGIAVDNESAIYNLNDVITWWDWHQLSQNEQKYFVKETYVNVDACTIDGTVYEAGTYVLENDASVHSGIANQTAWKVFQTANHTVLNAAGEAVTDLSSLFHPSNNISHDTGYVLTLDMDSPKDWGDWYVPIDATSGLPKIRKDAYDALSDADKAKYREGPTYTLKSGEGSGLYGQRQYAVGEIISDETYKDYTTTVSAMNPLPEGQATVEPAYVAVKEYGTMQAGTAISTTAYNALSESDKTHFAPAMVCVNTIQLGEEEFVLLGELVSGTDDDLDALANKYMAYNNGKINADPIDHAGALKYIKDNLSNAYYITGEGLYGGQYFKSGTNYAALKSWCELTESRNKFDFNYDALDVLVDPQYHGEGSINTYYHSPYSEIKSVEYTAAYTGGENGTKTLTYTDGNNVSHTLYQGDPISREDYENYIPNEQLHYTRIQVEKGSDQQTFYIVKENIINNGTPYAKGQDISEKDYNSLTDANKALVAEVTIDKDHNETQILHYCFEDYTPSNSSFSTISGSGDPGAAGSIITDDVFTHDIPNNQKDFTIQGAEPTETTTLYVSRESNAKDVTAEKVISVVYQYTYYEADDEGEGVSLVNELHVVNIHLQLESGAPEIGPLTAPPTVLPGNTVGLKAPTVNPGLYEVLTSGWELFSDENDAMLHRNGTPFTNNGTKLYWYQNQKVWLAFYSKTYLGKTYSNYVPLTVANYHDLDAIMKDKEHHLYVDHPGVMRNSKIYIDNRDCESDENKSELDLLKDFFDLSLLTSSPDEGSTLAGHSLLNDRVKGGAKLEFVLNSDVSPKAYTNWVPIGDETQCFMGTFHGDGYTVSGLDHSLFGKLCGDVYNLGVTGSFTSAGVVDTGDGYVENCWINTTGTPNGSVKAVFGNPGDASRKQTVNCYYPNTKNYAAGDAHPMTETEFYNGTVAYNLNGFYLNKRYYDHAALTSETAYQYLKDENGTLSENFVTGYYPDEPDAKYGDVGYVEERYADGDFIYADGTIPEAYDERMRVVTVGEASVVKYAPIWPDDYIFFGQALTYGYNSLRPHNDEPTHVVKSSGRLPLNNNSNRVYRAPAYYKSKDMSVAHYNLNAYLAAQSAPKTITDTDLKDAYPNMTAIDFAGHNDNTWSLGTPAGTAWFYPPLLDNEDGLLSISNEGETPNLLVYAPSDADNEKTYDVLTDYFVEPAYTDYYDTDDAYRCVQTAPASTVHGHLVQSTLTATNDHLLVDKRDFNCPISYSFDDGYRMWYQRTPDRYVDINKGWETICLPFTVELVTTPNKGELTHFYQGSTTGHEYWLRELDPDGQLKQKQVNGADVAGVYIADFNPLAAGTNTKEYTNTFLWDYYYSHDDNTNLIVDKDKNEDEYQKTYYKEGHNFTDYPYLMVGNPYLVGFPGATYYEFDLSGTWEPLHRYQDNTIDSKDRQTITFASAASSSSNPLTIGVSDSEMAGVTESGYTFKPTYLNNPTIEGNMNVFLLDADGDSFDKTDANAIDIVAFRPYFMAPVTNSARQTRSVEQIVFGQSDSKFSGEEHGDPRKNEIGGTLDIYAKRHKIVVESSLAYTVDVRIVNTAGITLNTFTIEPGESVETRVNTSGVYIVQPSEVKYTKKLAVR